VAAKPAFNPVAVTAASPAPAATPAKVKTDKLDVGQLLNKLKSRLAQNKAMREAGDAKDLAMSAVARIAPDLHTGIAAALEHFGFDFDENSNGLRFIPEGVREDGTTRPAALYFLSLAANGESDGAALRWGTQTKEYGEEDIYPTGVRVVGKEAVLNTPALTCPIGLLVKAGLTDDQQRAMALAGTFSELAGYLRASAGGGIVSELPEGFMMLLNGFEERTSKKGNKYTLLNGTQLSADSLPIGEVSIFPPGNKDAAAWLAQVGAVVLQFDSELKVMNVLDKTTGAALEALPMMAKTLKLKELKVGEVYDWVGCELVTFKDGGKGWVVKLRHQKSGTTVSCYTNRTIENTITGGAEMILEAAGIPTDNLDLIFKVDSEKPFGTVKVRSQTPYGEGKVSVDVECLINKTETEEQAEDELFAELGLI